MHVADEAYAVCGAPCCVCYLWYTVLIVATKCKQLQTHRGSVASSDSTKCNSTDVSLCSTCSKRTALHLGNLHAATLVQLLLQPRMLLSLYLCCTVYSAAHMQKQLDNGALQTHGATQHIVLLSTLLSEVPNGREHDAFLAGSSRSNASMLQTMCRCICCRVASAIEDACEGLCKRSLVL